MSSEDIADEASSESPPEIAEPVAEPTPITMTLGEVDDDGFATVWSIASASCEGDVEQTRALAAKLLLFLCKKKCDFIVTSSSNAEYLANWFEREKKLMYDWKPESEFVDVVSQHAEVPGQTLIMFLKNKNFDTNGKYNATRAERVAWFEEAWCVG
jgi:hypothetical protein